MRIAYIDLVHKDPILVERVAKRLTQGTNNTIFIHIDKKIDINDFSNIIESKNIRFIKNRVEVNWAGFSSIKATINSFKEALDYGNYDRFVILQNLDYPLKSNKEIEEFFNNNNNKEYICARKDTGLNSESHKYCLYWKLDDKDFISKICNAFCKTITTLKININFKKDYIVLHNQRYDIYRGWDQIALTKKAIKYIVDFYDSNLTFNNYFNSCFASDESYFHTILYNSKIFSISNNNKQLLNLTYFEYPDVVRLFNNPDEIKNIDLKDFLFIRKVSSKSSKELFDFLDKRFH